MDKKKLLKIASAAVIAIIIAVVVIETLVSKSLLFFSNNKDGLKNWATTTFLNGEEVTLNKPIIKTNEGDFLTNADDLLQTTLQNVGKEYRIHNGQGKGPNTFDCSGLVWWTLKQYGKTSGFPVTSVASYIKGVPQDTNHWLWGDTKGRYWSEVGRWVYNDKDGKYKFEKNGGSSSIYSADLKYNNNNINVLKVNDPITQSLRYYEYYDDNQNKKELPAGSIVVSVGSLFGGLNHAWMCLGDLGTSDPDEVKAYLVSKYGEEFSEKLKTESEMGDKATTQWGKERLL